MNFSMINTETMISKEEINLLVIDDFSCTGTQLCKNIIATFIINNFEYEDEEDEIHIRQDS